MCDDDGPPTTPISSYFLNCSFEIDFLPPPPSQAVKVVYADMDLQGVYDRYEAKAYDDLCAEIAREGVLPINLQTPLLGLLNKIHKRKR